MDSLSQIALGSAVSIAVMGRRTSVLKAAAWGAVCGTLPDLDALIDHGDPIRNMTFHRAESHALFYLTLASPLIATLIVRIHRETKAFGRRWLAVWLALATHPLLDLMTVYGTQLGLPFTDHPFAVGSIFIIDPLYTLPLLAGVGTALYRGSRRGRLWNTAGLAVSTGYLAWSVLAQQQVTAIASASLKAQGMQVERLLVTPSPFNTVLWRIVAVSPEGYYEGFHSLLDRDSRVEFDRFPRGKALYDTLRGDWHVERVAWFSRGFFKMSQDGVRVLMSDLRMGQEPQYTFTFVVAQRTEERTMPIEPLMLQRRVDLQRGLDWLWRRALGDPLPPLR